VLEDDPVRIVEANTVTDDEMANQIA